MSDCSVQRQFLMEVSVDERTYALIMNDVNATGYNGSLIITYFDDKATGAPHKVLYGNGVEVVFTKFEKRSVDLS